MPGESRFTEIRDKDQIGVVAWSSPWQERSAYLSQGPDGPAERISRRRLQSHQKKGQTETTLTLTSPQVG